ncbi:hypothetical protein DDE05_00455 [Streptomyces cavourensis]|nr:hypothetical protein DDE05_00455 [Streptomyces cavourensis]
MQALTYDAMRTDLATTFPGLWMHPLREFGEQWKNAEGIWTRAEGEVLMPDGLPVFERVNPDFDDYDGTVHHGFIAWLKARGWAWDRYDGSTYFLVSESNFGAPTLPAEDAPTQGIASVAGACMSLASDDELPF